MITRPLALHVYLNSFHSYCNSAHSFDYQSASNRACAWGRSGWPDLASSRLLMAVFRCWLNCLVDALVIERVWSSTASLATSLVCSPEKLTSSSSSTGLLHWLIQLFQTNWLGQCSWTPGEKLITTLDPIPITHMIALNICQKGVRNTKRPSRTRSSLSIFKDASDFPERNGFVQWYSIISLQPKSSLY